MTASNTIVPSSNTYTIIIVGGGLAGLCAALHLSIKGEKVLLIEKNEYPKHKVCGEYISNEVLPYLQALGINPFELGATNITQFQLSTAKGRSIKTRLSGGGFGISRYCIDWELAKKATENGAIILQDKVVDIQFANEEFSVETQLGKEYKATFVIGSFGKRSNLDVQMDRDFIQQPTPFLAIKAHYKGDFRDDMVALHNFEGGYCGLSKVETDLVNVCYIADYTSFKKHKNIDDFQQHVLSQNPHLKKVFDQYELTFDKPITISQISFATKQAVEDHIIMCGDSAGMIHPLAGNGMSMAIRAAQLASLHILQFQSGHIHTRAALEAAYTQAWNQQFKKRLRSGHIIANLFRLGLFSELIMIFLKIVPFVLSPIIKKTHGKTMKPTL